MLYIEFEFMSFRTPLPDKICGIFRPWARALASKYRDLVSKSFSRALRALRDIPTVYIAFKL